MNALTGTGILLLAPSLVWLLRPGRRLPAAGATEAAGIGRNRLVTIGFVLAFLLTTLGLFPQPEQRAEFQYLFVITLGYGHLIGGAVFGRERMQRLIPDSVPRGPLLAFGAMTILLLFALYGWSVHLAAPFALVGMLSISTWHIFENDLALGRAYRAGLRLEPMPRGLDHHASALALTALVIALSLATIDLAAWQPVLRGTPFANIGNLAHRVFAAAVGLWLCVRHGWTAFGALGLGLIATALVIPARVEDVAWLAFGDVFSAVTLYHLFGWLVFFSDRARSLAARGDRPAARAMGVRIVRVHLPPAALCVALLLGGSAGAWETSRFWVFSPAIYLFWSVLHVFQTLATRGFESRARLPLEARG